MCTVLWLRTLEQNVDRSTKIYTTWLQLLEIFLWKVSYSCTFFLSPWALERCVDRSTKIDTTYAFVTNSIFALIWFNSFGLMNQRYFHNFLYIKKKTQKSLNIFFVLCENFQLCPQLVILMGQMDKGHFFPRPNAFVPEKNPSSLHSHRRFVWSGHCHLKSSPCTAHILIPINCRRFNTYC